MIDEGSQNGTGGSLSGAISMMTKQQQDESGMRPQYSMPGILHFLQTEWARFEMERSQWEVERAELQVKTHLNALIYVNENSMLIILKGCRM